MRSRLAVVAALALLVLGTGFDPWQTTWRETREGNRALAEGNAEDAVRHYTEALSRSPDDPRILFDLGNALARLGRLEEARQAWARAAQLGEGKIRRDAWYNRGLAELLGGDPRAAAEAFTRALLTDPGDEEARHNLDLALRRLQQEKKKRQQRQQAQGGKKQERDRQRSEQGDRGRDRQRRQQQEQGARGERQRKQEPRGAERKQEQARDRQANRRQEERGDRRQEQPRPEEKSRAGGTPGKRETAAEREAREMAERLLRRLAADEKNALRRALRRRVPAGKKREKDW